MSGKELSGGIFKCGGIRLFVGGANNQNKKVYNDGIIPRSCGAGNFNECEDAWNPGTTVREMSRSGMVRGNESRKKVRVKVTNDRKESYVLQSRHK